MDTENKRESNVRLELETIRKIERDFAENSKSDNQTMLELINQRIAVWEIDKEGNKELLEQYYVLREDILNRIQGEENK